MPGSPSRSRVATRPQNANIHPGATIKRKRRTKAEMEADRKKAEEAKKEKLAKKTAGLKKIAELEERMVEEDENDATPRPKVPQHHPRALRRRSSHLEIPLYSEDSRKSVEIASTFSVDEYHPPTDEPRMDDTNEAEQPARKKAKSKEKVRDIISAARKETIGADDELGRVHQHEARFAISAVNCRHMLTLDETTLFYFSLYSFPESTARGKVKDWTSRVNDFAPHPTSKTNTTSSSRSKSQIPALTTASTHSSRSVLTDDIVITGRNYDTGAGSDVNWLGGLEDENETYGEERDAAASSPIKGKIRLVNTVSRYYQHIPGCVLTNHLVVGHCQD